MIQLTIMVIKKNCIYWIFSCVLFQVSLRVLNFLLVFGGQRFFSVPTFSPHSDLSTKTQTSLIFKLLPFSKLALFSSSLEGRKAIDWMMVCVSLCVSQRYKERCITIPQNIVFVKLLVWLYLRDNTKTHTSLTFKLLPY